ncbi:plasmid pRiA4b ORF-3 family protein [Thermodesulfobacteriota bacterium]
MNKAKKTIIYQFRVELNEIDPPIWRRIQVPAKYSYWDLHVALQDSMGWLDCHLHAFRLRMPHKRKEIQIGIPDDGTYGDVILAGWEISIADYFTEPGKSAFYEYDFGDGWDHTVLLEGILLKEKGVKYPKCIAGERACPPEGCGGLPGYYQLLEIIGNPNHPEYQEYIAWLKGHAGNYYPYDPDRFDPDQVVFWNPEKRWRIAFSESGE